VVAIEIIYSHFLKYESVSTDSRKIEPNCIFFALKGENFNGNLYALEALKKGAAFVVVDEKLDSVDKRVLYVPNVLIALQKFANKYRSEFQIPIIAITGSNGKTTTKELMASILGTQFKTHFTNGNLNNHIGVPLTLLHLRREHEIAIIEMGANHVGEIAALCKIAAPTHGLITNIGMAHLEGFGGVEGVKKGKGELFDFLEQNNGVVFVNESEPTVKPLADIRNLKMVKFSYNSKHMGFVNLKYTKNSSPLEIKLDCYNNLIFNLQTQLHGKYNLPNILYAICIGLYFKVPINRIMNALKSYVPDNNRSQLLEIGSNKFILDAYNANPSSMELAINNFKDLDHHKKIVLLGDMNELGEYTDQEHKRIANLALTGGFSKVLFIGKNFPNNDFGNVSSLKTWFDEQEWEDCFFLVKGSRAVALEKLLV